MPAVLRDGSTLPLEESTKLFAEGRYNQVPVILGTNRDELKLFLFRDPELVHWWFGALPSIRDDLGATAEALQWVMNAYLLPTC